MREVQYMIGLNGQRVAVDTSQQRTGYEFNGVIYDTPEEANRAEGESNQRIYLSDQEMLATESLAALLEHVRPSRTLYWEDRERNREKNVELARELIAEIFPMRGERHSFVAVLLSALEQADIVYREMRDRQS